MARLLRYWAWLVELISSERLLRKRENGGALIFLRAILISAGIWILTIAVKNLVDPNRGFSFSRREFQLDIVSTMPWFAAIFAGEYAALYARFSTQWLYLAGLYNSIKQAESCGSSHRPDSKHAIAEWKAGFLEDAQQVHLATKPAIASVIHAWARDPAVREAFCKNTPGGKRRLEALLKIVEECCDRQAHKWISQKA